MNKYGAKPITIDGIKFASQREAKYYADYKDLERAGKIHGLRVHPVYQIVVQGAKIGRYTADFEYRSKDGVLHVIDVKSPPTARGEAFRLRKKIVEAIYPHLKIEVVF